MEEEDNLASHRPPSVEVLLVDLASVREGSVKRVVPEEAEEEVESMSLKELVNVVGVGVAEIKGAMGVRIVDLKEPLDSGAFVKQLVFLKGFETVY